MYKRQFEDGELPNRAISDIPHPFVSETMDLFEKEENMVKQRIHFIHFNHTNPLLFDEKKRRMIKEKGFNISEQGKSYE